MPQNLDHRTEEVQEIIGQVPSWIIRRGIIVIFIVIAIFIWISWFVKYPDIVEGTAMITTRTSPIQLVSQDNGTLHLLVRDKSSVEKGEIVAYLEKNASLEDVLYIETSFNNNADPIREDIKIGELQPLLSKWKLAKNKLAENQLKQPHANEVKFLNQQMTNLKKLNQNLANQINIFESELVLVSDKFKADSLLFNERVISELAYKESKVSFLQEQRKLRVQKASIIDNDYRINDIKKQISLLEAESTIKMSYLKQELINAKEDLSSAISFWKQKNLFISPFQGEITFLDFLQDDQYVQLGQTLFAIVPREDEFYARVTLPVFASGKVQVGQEVNIKLDNFPSSEYGMLKGQVSQISTIPGKDVIKDEYAYVIMVDLSSGLITTYNKELPNGQYLTGRMEIITHDRRVLERIFSWARAIRESRST